HMDNTFSSIAPENLAGIQNGGVEDSMAFSRIDKDFDAGSAGQSNELDVDGDITIGEDSFAYGKNDAGPSDDTMFSMVDADMTNFHKLLAKDGSPAKQMKKAREMAKTVGPIRCCYGV